MHRCHDAGACGTGQEARHQAVPLGQRKWADACAATHKWVDMCQTWADACAAMQEPAAHSLCTYVLVLVLVLLYLPVKRSKHCLT